MAFDEGVVFGEAGEAVAHAVVAHCGEVEALEVGEEEGVAGFVPGAVADVEGGGGVGAAARGGEVVCHLVWKSGEVRYGAVEVLLDSVIDSWRS